MIQTGEMVNISIRKQLLMLAVPLLVGDILQQLYNTIDTFLVGRYVGGDAFAAVGVAGSVMNLFLFLISGVCTGAGILFSQFYGAKKYSDFRKDFFLSALAGGIFSCVLILAALGTLQPLLIVLQTPVPLRSYATQYLTVIFLGFPAAFAFHLASAALRGAGNTRAALFFLMISMGTNLILDIVFIAGLNWGVAGAAIATVAAQVLAAGLALIYLRIRFPQLMFRRPDMVMDMPLLIRTAHFGVVSALHNCSLYIGKLLVQGTVNSLGTASISAYTAATRIEGFANSFGTSGGTAVSVFVGQNTGAGDTDQVRRGFRTGMGMLGIFGLLISAVLILCANACLSLVLPEDSGESLGPAMAYLRLVACFYMFNFLGCGLVGLFQGLGKINLPVIGATGHISLRVVLSALLAPFMGLPAVALASGLGWFCVVIFWSLIVWHDSYKLRKSFP